MRVAAQRMKAGECCRLGSRLTKEPTGNSPTSRLSRPVTYGRCLREACRPVRESGHVRSPWIGLVRLGNATTGGANDWIPRFLRVAHSPCWSRKEVRDRR